MRLIKIILRVSHLLAIILWIATGTWGICAMISGMIADSALGFGAGFMMFIFALIFCKLEKKYLRPKSWNWKRIIDPRYLLTGKEDG